MILIAGLRRKKRKAKNLPRVLTKARKLQDWSLASAFARTGRIDAGRDRPQTEHQKVRHLSHQKPRRGNSPLNPEQIRKGHREKAETGDKLNYYKESCARRNLRAARDVSSTCLVYDKSKRYYRHGCRTIIQKQYWSSPGLFEYIETSLRNTGSVC